MIENLNNYLKSTTQQTLDDGSKEVCDLITGECYVVKEKDGLIESLTFPFRSFISKNFDLNMPIFLFGFS